jgi:thiopeptide-type bacteriocin biosynthesis protein
VKDFISSGFFALRTPLLPFDELLSWAEGLQASGSLGNPMELERAVAQDRALLRARLREIVSRPEIREALFIASTHLDDAVGIWSREPDCDRGQGIELALLRYFVRMAARPTPFGLCAGCSVGLVGDKTNLVVEERAKYRRHTRLTMDYLFALTESMRGDPALRKAFIYRPNSSLYRVAGRLRYVASRLKDKELSYHLVILDDADYLASTLNRAGAGAAFDALAAALVDEEVTVEEAEAYINELVDSQILVADIPLSVTGAEPIDRLIEHLREIPQTTLIAGRLEQARAELAAMDVAGLGVAPARYRGVANLLGGLPTEPDLARLFQIDLVKPAPKATLGKAVLAEIARGVEVLHRLQTPATKDELTHFRDRFVKRYEGREVPVLEALDEEDGVGFASGSEATPLLEGLHLSPAPDESAPWGEPERLLIRKLSEALQDNAHEVILTKDDLDEITSGHPPPLPGAFAAMVTIVASSESALTQGNFRVVLGGASGPSGARLLGRFCHADEQLRKHVEKHLGAEEALHPDAVFAEIVHLPEGRSGFLCRPALRTYEIPYLGHASVNLSEQIDVAELTVSVREERIVLRSAKLGREVIPRMTNSHNYRMSTLGVYKFLCALQSQGVFGGATWNWGVLTDAPFLPRVVTGRLVLRAAQWRISKKELASFGHVRESALFQIVQAWRAQRRLPRWVAIADGDNVLPIDFDNVLSVEMFAHLVRSREEATLTEVFPGPNELCVSGPEGRFVHELVVPFVRTSEAGKPAHPHSPPHFLPSLAARTFSPGSEWLFVKVYTGATTIDRMLCEIFAPLIREVLASGAVDRWFFIRYADPDWHVRLRFHGRPERLHAELLPALHDAVAPLLKDGRLRRLQFDTYDREVERYGGPEGIEVAERLSHADSEAVLKMIALLEPGDAGLGERWRLTLRGIDALLTDCGFDLASKCALFKRMPKGLAEVARVNTNLKGELGEKFRRERKSLEELLDPERDRESALSLGLDILRQRSERMGPIVADLKAIAEAGQLLVPLEDFVMSCVHMHANRLLRSAHREQEWVIYDFLARLYKSRAAYIN